MIVQSQNMGSPSLHLKWSNFLEWTAEGLISISVLLMPIFLLLGFIDGKEPEGIYSKLPDNQYWYFANLSWLPFVVAAGLAELLRANRAWLKGALRPRLAGALWPFQLFALEVLLACVLLVATVWMGAVLGQVWLVRHGFAAVVVVALMLVLTAGLYLCCAFDQTGAESNYNAIHDFTESAIHQNEDWRTVYAQPPSALTTPQLSASSTKESAISSVQDSAQTSSGADLAPTASERPTFEFQWERPNKGFESLAGMQSLKAELQDAILRFRHYADFSRGLISNDKSPGTQSAIADQNGILLSGPPGNGKTAFATAIAAELKLPFVKLGCGDLTSKWINESPQLIKDLFRQASQQPCVVFFDEFDGIAMSRSNGNMHAEDRKVVTALLKEIDDARSKPIVLIGATNFVDQIDAAIARPGRFDFAIDIPPPDFEARKVIIRQLLDKSRQIVDRVTLERVAVLWERHSVAFITAAVKRVQERVRERGDMRAYMADFKMAARAVSKKASAIPAEGPKLSDIILPASVRQAANSLLYRLKNWEEIKDRGGEPPTGVMLYGPPGTGKSMFVKALARDLGDWHVFEVCASDVIQNPKAFQQTLDMATAHRPAFVFIDEADELLANRSGGWNSGATNQVLKSIDGYGGKVPEVVFVAATNRIDAIDPAALRGGRFSEKIHMDLLRGEDLRRFVQNCIEKLPGDKLGNERYAESIASEFVEAAPADVVSYIRSLVNASFHTRACG